MVGWVQSVNSTFLRCLRDASKPVCCFALVQHSREIRSSVATLKTATCSPSESPIAQWLERHTGIWKVLGSIPAEGSDFFPEHYLVVRDIYF